MSFSSGLSSGRGKLFDLSEAFNVETEFKNDGNSQPKMCATREELRAHPDVKREILIFWLTRLIDGNGNTPPPLTNRESEIYKLPKSDYIRIHQSFSKALFPMFDESDSLSAAESDFLRDSKGKSELDKNQFLDAIFEIAETSSLNSAEYVRYLRVIYHRITRIAPIFPPPSMTPTFTALAGVSNSTGSLKSRRSGSVFVPGSSSAKGKSALPRNSMIKPSAPPKSLMPADLPPSTARGYMELSDIETIPPEVLEELSTEICGEQELQKNVFVPPSSLHSHARQVSQALGLSELKRSLGEAKEEAGFKKPSLFRQGTMPILNINSAAFVRTAEANIPEVKTNETPIKQPIQPVQTIPAVVTQAKPIVVTASNSPSSINQSTSSIQSPSSATIPMSVSSDILLQSPTQTSSNIPPTIPVSPSSSSSSVVDPMISPPRKKTITILSKRSSQPDLASPAGGGLLIDLLGFSVETFVIHERLAKTASLVDSLAIPSNTLSISPHPPSARRPSASSSPRPHLSGLSIPEHEDGSITASSPLVMSAVSNALAAARRTSVVAAAYQSPVSPRGSAPAPASAFPVPRGSITEESKPADGNMRSSNVMASLFGVAHGRSGSISMPPGSNLSLTPTPEPSRSVGPRLSMSPQPPVSPMSATPPFDPNSPFPSNPASPAPPSLLRTRSRINFPESATHENADIVSMRMHKLRAMTEVESVLPPIDQSGSVVSTAAMTGSFKLRQADIADAVNSIRRNSVLLTSLAQMESAPANQF